MKRDFVGFPNYYAVFCFSISVEKTYSDKARTPQPDDYTYGDDSYTYNLDADGRLNRE